MSQAYLTSDLHLGHRSIIKHRPIFSSVEEHDKTILVNIAALPKRDLLFILGDFIFDSDNYSHYIHFFKNNVRCRIKLIMGNHDSLDLYNEPRFEMQLPLLSYKNMWLSHCPIHPNELRSRLGNIHGHLHLENLDDTRYFNVNTDVNDFKPVPFNHIKEQIR